MIEIRDLCVQYDKDILALNHISVQISDGEKVAVVGANGAGKSTFLLSIMGIVSRQSGSVQMDRIEVNQKNQAHIFKKVGLVFQNPDDQLFMPTVREDVEFGPRHFLDDEKEIENQVKNAVELMGIEELLNRSSHRLSGGEKRRVALASVLAMEPSLLLLDEPAAFLDPRARRHFIHALNHLSITQIMATHDLDMALEVCNRVIVLYQGSIMADGAPKDVLTDRNLMDRCALELPLCYQGSPF